MARHIRMHFSFHDRARMCVCVAFRRYLLCQCRCLRRNRLRNHRIQCLFHQQQQRRWWRRRRAHIYLASGSKSEMWRESFFPSPSLSLSPHILALHEILVARNGNHFDMVLWKLYTLRPCVERCLCFVREKKKRMVVVGTVWWWRWRLYPNNSDKVDAIITIIIRNDIGL